MIMQSAKFSQLHHSVHVIFVIRLNRTTVYMIFVENVTPCCMATMAGLANCT